MSKSWFNSILVSGLAFTLANPVFASEKHVPDDCPCHDKISFEENKQKIETFMTIPLTTESKGNYEQTELSERHFGLDNFYFEHVTVKHKNDSVRSIEGRTKHALFIDNNGYKEAHKLFNLISDSVSKKYSHFDHYSYKMAYNKTNTTKIFNFSYYTLVLKLEEKVFEKLSGNHYLISFQFFDRSNDHTEQHYDDEMLKTISLF